MYNIQKTDYGFRLIFRGHFGSDEASEWLEKFTAAVDKHQPDFCVFVDMRNLIPLDQVGKELIQQGQEHARFHGMARSVVIPCSPVITMQFKSIAAQSGILTYERYIDATSSDDWEELGLGWILQEQDPDTVIADRTI